MTGTLAAVARYHASLADGLRRSWVGQNHTDGRVEAPYIVGRACEVADVDGDLWLVEPVWIAEGDDDLVYTRDPVRGAVSVWRWESRGWQARTDDITAALSRIGDDTDLFGGVLLEGGMMRVFVAGRHDDPPPVPPIIPRLLAELSAEQSPPDQEA